MVRSKVRTIKTEDKVAKLPGVDGGKEKKRKKRRWRKRWVREVLDNSVASTVIPKASIERVIREVLQQNSVSVGGDSAASGTLRMRKSAVDALQLASEQFLTDIMSLTNELTVLRNRQTIDVKSFQLARRIVCGRI